MVEIVFGDSTAAFLKEAQLCGKTPYSVSGLQAFADADEKEEQKDLLQREMTRRKAMWETATPMEKAEIYAFPLYLSVGQLSGDCLGADRLAVLENLFSVYPSAVGTAAAGKLMEGARTSVPRFLKKVRAGEEARIWYSDQPDEMCGFFWFFSLLSGCCLTDVRITAVKLPAWEVWDGRVICRSGWNQVVPEDWHRCSKQQETVSPALCRWYAEQWEKLCGESAPLRAVVNGRLQSAEETLYDDLIRREIASEPVEFQEAHVIGTLLGKCYPGLTDQWIALRMEKMIRAGELLPLTEAPPDAPSYHRLLQKKAGGRNLSPGISGIR